MSNYALVQQLLHNLLQHTNVVQAQLQGLKRVWAIVREERNVPPSIFVSILKVCSKIGRSALKDGETLHRHLATAPVISKLAPSMSTSPSRNLVIWNSLISMYTRCGAPSKALQLWSERPSHMTPDKFTMTCVLSACAAVGSNEGLHVGKEVHYQLQSISYSSWDETLFTALVNMYAKCNSPQNAVLLWKIAHNFKMRSWKGTLKCFLKACSDLASQEALSTGYQIKEFMRKLPASEIDVALENSLINMLVKCRDAESALAYWDNSIALQPSKINTQIATTALLACAQIGPEALERGKLICKQTDSEQARMNPLYTSALISMHAKCGDSDTALIIWKSFAQRYTNSQHITPIPHLDVVCAAAFGACSISESERINIGRDIRHFTEAHGISPSTNIRICNALMLMYAKCGAGDSAFELWQQLLDSKQLKPNGHSYLAILMACASKGQLAYETGKSIRTNMSLDPSEGQHTILNVYGAMINMYGKCGSWNEAESLFQWCCNNFRPSLSICNAMLSAYGEHGQGSKACELFDWLLANNINPDYITFVNLLNAYSHSGLVDEALRVFDTMKSRFKITPSKVHITCLVDALGRNGLLEQAEELVNSLKDCDAVVYSSLLSSCRLKRDIDRAERVAAKAMSLEKSGEQATTPYILLGNTYLATANYEKAKELSKKMSEKGMQRKYGQSTVVINGEAHTFGPNDRSHPNSDQIHAQIDKMERQLMQDGYTHNTSWVMQDAAEERKKYLLCRHSEKLALAYALLKTSDGETIRIDKNLRICGDCHDATSRLSRIYARTIVLRDTRRFHHFHEGKCSCGGIY